MHEPLRIRKAGHKDIPAIEVLISASVRGLMQRSYSLAQLEAALGVWLGVDSQLVRDGTYLVVESEARDGTRVLAGCGGWSRRKTEYGSDRRPGRNDALLDPATEAARIRAFFTHPGWACRGIGSRILQACERSAVEAGFKRFELGATLTAVPFYERRGYLPLEQIALPLANGENFPILRMTKTA